MYQAMLGKTTEPLGSVGVTPPITSESKLARVEVFLNSQYLFCLFIYF